MLEPYLVVVVPYVGLVEGRVEDSAISLDVNAMRVCLVSQDNYYPE